MVHEEVWTNFETQKKILKINLLTKSDVLIKRIYFAVQEYKFGSSLFCHFLINGSVAINTMSPKVILFIAK